MKKLLAAAALILAPAAAQAEDWVLVTVSDNLSGAMFVDVDSLSAPGGPERSGRVFAVLREDSGPYAGVVADMTFDCKGRRQRIGKIDAYDNKGAMFNSEPGADEWRPIQPASNYEYVMQAMCGEVKFEGQHFGAKVPVLAGRELLLKRTREKQ